MFRLYKVEFVKRIKTVLMFFAAIGGMVFVSMMFFKTIAENMEMLDSFLSTGMMNNILGAFNINVSGMKSLVGFFSTYCTMWVMMVGGVFFAYFGAEMISKEERTGTIEFLALKPFSRVEVFISKCLVLQSYIVLFFIGIYLVGALSLTLQKPYASWSVNENALNQSMIEAIQAKGDVAVSDLIGDEDLFKRFTTTMLMTSFTASDADLSKAGIDAKGLIDALGDEIDNPEQMFEHMLNDPSKYMEVFKTYATSDEFKNMTAEQFISNVKEEQKNYASLRADFVGSTHILRDYFSYSPAFFSEVILQKGMMSDLILGVPEAKALFTQLNWTGFNQVLINMWIVVAVLGTLGLSMSSASKLICTNSQIVLLVGIVFYFANSIISLSPVLGFLKWFTPFGYADTSGDSLNWINLLILMVISFIIASISLRYYKRRDFIRQ
ncbi:ABC transporter permease subunit [Fusibacter bizertensis]